MVAEIKPVNAAGMPAPVAPYSNAVRAKASEFLFIAGQVALDAAGHVVGVGDLEAHLLQSRRIVADQVGAQPGERERSRLAASTHLTQSDQSIVRFDLDNRPDKPAPVATVGVAQRCFERDRDRRRPDVNDLHAPVGKFARSTPCEKCDLPTNRLHWPGQRQRSLLR